MAKTFTVAGTVSVPLEDGQTPAVSSLTQAITYTKKATFDLVYADPVIDDEITFGSLVTAGAKGLLIKCTAGSCTIKIDIPGTPGNVALPFNTGGLLLFANPAAGLPSGCHITVGASAALEISAVG
jgi:hypothetical protein